MTLLPPIDTNEIASDVLIFPAKFRKDEPDHIRVFVNRGKYCTHRFRMDVDFEKRTAKCGGCGAELSHWEVIELMAKDYDRRVQHREYLKREVGSLETRLEVLKKLEAKVRRRVQTLIERATGQKANAWSLRMAIDQAAHEALRPGKVAP